MLPKKQPPKPKWSQEYKESFLNDASFAIYKAMHDMSTLAPAMERMVCILRDVQNGKGIDFHSKFDLRSLQTQLGTSNDILYKLKEFAEDLDTAKTIKWDSEEEILVVWILARIPKLIEDLEVLVAICDAYREKANVALGIKPKSKDLLDMGEESEEEND